MGGPGTLAVLDANVLIHYRFFPEIDWCTELGVPQVTLVILPAVVHELDERKWSKSEQPAKKARSVLSRLREIDDGGRIREGTSLSMPLHLCQVDPAAHGLNPGSGDDRILAQTLALRASQPEHAVVLVTADTGLSLKATSRGIHVRELREDLLQPVEPDRVRQRIARLEQEVAELQKRQPVLVLEFTSTRGEKDARCIPAVQLPGDPDLDQAVAEERARLAYPPTTATGVWVHSLATLRPPENEVKRYERELQAYLDRYREWLQNRAAYEYAAARSLQICLRLSNDGGAPAEDVDVFLGVPSHVDVGDEAFPGQAPEQPSPPVLPSFGAGLAPLLAALQRPQPWFGAPLGPWRCLEVPGAQPNVTGPSVEQKEEWQVRYHVVNVKHHMSVDLEPFWIRFPEEVRAAPLQLSYSLYPNNAPQPFKGKLLLDVREGVSDA